MREGNPLGCYILVGQTPVEEPDLVKWGVWIADITNRTVFKTPFGFGNEVSTVFLGSDHQWRSAGPPILFETMVFGGWLDERQLRYSDWRQAERGHRRMLGLVRRSYGSCWPYIYLRLLPSLWKLSLPFVLAWYQRRWYFRVTLRRIVRGRRWLRKLCFERTLF